MRDDVNLCLTRVIISDDRRILLPLNRLHVLVASKIHKNTEKYFNCSVTRLGWNIHYDPLRQKTTLALVYFIKEGAAHLLGDLMQVSLIGMGIGYVEVVDVSGSVTLLGIGPGAMVALAVSSTSAFWAVRLEEVEPHY